ncbi:MAG: hypothetical protein ACTHKP_08600 [Nitrososphaeraceae archaeon]
MAAAYPICCWVTLWVDVRRDKDSLVGMTNKRQEDYCLLDGFRQSILRETLLQIDYRNSNEKIIIVTCTSCLKDR